MYMVYEPVNNSDNFLITGRLNQLNQTLNDIEGKEIRRQRGRVVNAPD